MYDKRLAQIAPQGESLKPMRNSMIWNAAYDKRSLSRDTKGEFIKHTHNRRELRDHVSAERNLEERETAL